ncbi:MAG TPA: hypothetical protein VFH06_05205 [Candidatus Saccharimonadales bacterium]|nr:hypothetical protein [Candidatus Saccharimonadales bacterium]
MNQQTQKDQIPNEAMAAIATFQTGQDVKNAVLIVSVLANIALFVLWLTVQLTSQYNAALASWITGA